MPKRYPKQARDIAVQLYRSGLSVPEITRRFNEGTAGLTGREEKPIPIGITERRVAEYVAEHKAEHGPRPEPEDQELTADSINRVKQRALNVLAREIARLERVPAGRISAKQSTALRQHYATLDDMERRAEIAEKRKAKGRRAGKKPGATEGKGESAIEALMQAEKSGGDQSASSEETAPAQRDAGEVLRELEAAGFEGEIDPKPQEQARENGSGLSPEEIREIMGSAARV